jgi:aspartate-semialdehyde dehydrogenase
MKIAVLGATGSVGYWILEYLSTRGDISPADVFPLASSASAGKEVSFGDTPLKVQSSEGFNFRQVQVVFSALGERAAREILPEAQKAGCRVIDKSAAFRMQPDVPLVVPEVNGNLLNSDVSFVASPNCVAIPLSVPLAALEALVPLENLHVVTYQSVSGAGKKALDHLYRETKTVLMGMEATDRWFDKQIAFNVIPQIGELGAEGTSEEEGKIDEELQKILGRAFDIFVTAVRVPVFVGHSMAVHATFKEPFPLERARRVLENAPGLEITENYITPLECVGEESIFLSRLRQKPENPRTLQFWLTCDNLLKGAALNAVQIFERLIEGC